LNAPENALKDVTLNKATVFAFPGKYVVSAENDKAFIGALTTAFTQVKLTAYNKFGTDKTA